MAKMGLFDPFMEFENFLGQMISFEVLLKCHSLTLSKKCLSLRPCAYLRDKLDYLNNPPQDPQNSFFYGSYEILAMLEGKIREVSFI